MTIITLKNGLKKKFETADEFTEFAFPNIHRIKYVETIERDPLKLMNGKVIYRAELKGVP